MVTKTIWDKTNTVKAYEEKNYKRLKTTKAFLRICNPDDKVLDAGCATGGFYKAIKEVVPEIEYVGIDLTSKLIRRAKTMYPEVSFLLGDVRNLIFEDNLFDTVACWDVLVHVAEWRTVLKELYRVSKKNLIMTVQLKEKGKTIIDLNKSYQETSGEGREIDSKDKERGYYNIFNMDEFIGFLKGLVPRPAYVKIDAEYGFMLSSVHVPPRDRINLNTIVLVGKGPAERTNVKIKIRNKLLTLAKSGAAQILQRLGF